MRVKRSDAVQLRVLQNAPVLLFVAVFVLFGVLEPTFFRAKTLETIVSQSAITGILAVGMTFVLLTAGIDLSVGAAMYLAAVIMGKVLSGDAGFLPALVLCTLVGVGFGTVNALVITRLRVVAFIVTLAMMFVGRGVGVSISKSEAVDFPESVRSFASQKIATPIWDIPLPIVIFALVALIAHVVLTRTTYGRQTYAVGNDAEAAEKAGINTRRVIAGAYVICGACAGLAAVVAAAQLGNASPGFGEQKEFDAIAAAVLGGTSLFGGRGNILPGTIIGALLIQTVAVGLVFTGVDIYYLDMVTALTIFVAVFIDALRTRKLTKLERRAIRSDAPDTPRRPPSRRAEARA
jgi:ribose transport system permease protein